MSHTDDYAAAVAAIEADAGPPLPRSVFKPSGDWILDEPDNVPAVWGDEASGRVLWAEGEPFMIAAPAGVGKTTIAGQLALARAGLVAGEVPGGAVLGFPVKRGKTKTLLIAADRPRQAKRSIRRSIKAEDRELLNERIVVFEGPPPRDFAKYPDTLMVMCQEAGADTVIIDSLKDMAVGISSDEVGSGLNLAIQRAIAAGIEVMVLHHQRKGQNGEKPKGLEDVYGSTWITAGMGSVVLLWGKAGDPMVELHHLKQPSHTVGPLTIEHDHETGRSIVHRGQVDPLVVLRKRANGLTAQELATLNAEGKEPSQSDERRAKRTLDRLTSSGLAHRTDAVRGGEGGTQPARYHAIERAVGVAA